MNVSNDSVIASAGPTAAGLVARGAGRVHLLGIGGVGMGGLAVLLQARGFTVTGCDRAPGRVTDWLRERGIEVRAGHDPAHLDAALAGVIYSPAVPADDPERAQAGRLGLPLYRRGEILPALLTDRRSIAVSGSHGKTTTTSFIAQLLRAAGAAPGWCVGGETPALGGLAGDGDAHTLVVEADESDGTLALYAPDVAVVTNIEFDHMEHFESPAAFESCFRQFVANAKGCVVYGRDDARAAALGARAPRAVSFGLAADADVRATALRPHAGGTRFRIRFGGADGGIVTLPVPGVHNVRNALAAAAVLRELGVASAAIVAALGALELPRRRFETVAAAQGVRVISDYAHHPGELAALIRTARPLAAGGRLLAVFQPHRFTRTRALGREFPAAFAGLDRLVLTPVYAASEPPLRGGSVWDLYRFCREAGLAPVPCVAPTLECAWAGLRRQLRAGDVLLVIGAGDVERIADWARAELTPPAGGSRPPPWREPPTGLHLSPASTVRLDEPLADKTTLKLGGAADIWIELACADDFGAVLDWTHRGGVPFTLLASGSNALINDLGVRGVTARLTGAGFHEIRRDGDQVRVGAAVTLAVFGDWLEARGLAGFEFMEGIPGSLGGGLQMNAGAWGQCLGDRLVRMRCLDRRGVECVVEAGDLTLGYRQCDFLKEHFVIDAVFRVGAGDAAAIAGQRAAIRARRAWMSGFRSAGSYFKNPPGDHAGRLLEAVGMHGRRVGGASIGTHHANFVVAGDGASAADVQALMEIGRAEVRETFAIELQPEVKILQ